MSGDLPHGDDFKEAEEKGDNEEMLKAFIETASCMHQLIHPNADSSGPEIKTDLNPADLSCTCKGCRKMGLCSHIIAITAEFIPGKYDRSHLEHLLERVSDKIRGAHRPKKTASGTQVQPDDVDDQEMEDDDHWEDLDLDMD